MRFLALLAFSTACASALRVPVISRRRTVTIGVSTAASLSVLPAYAKTPPGLDDELKVLIVKAKTLRASVRTTAAARRKLPMDPTPGVNNYSPLTLKVQRETDSVLAPLQAKLAAVAAKSSLPDSDLQKLLELQSVLMKGHMFELSEALKGYKFEAYTSKRTGKLYPGGKVERELEEVSDTCDVFVDLLSGKAPPPADTGD